MTQQCRLISACIIVFCLLSHSQKIQSDDSNEIYSYIRKIIFGTNVNIVNLTEIERNDDLIVPFVDDFNKQSNSMIETNNIDDLVQVDTLEINYLNEFDDYLADEQSRVQAILKKVDQELDEGRRLKHEQLAKMVSTFDSPFQGCSNDPYPASESKTIKKYVIDLDAPPEDRWKEVVQQHRDQITKLMNFFEETLGPEMMSVIDTALTWLHYSLPSEYYRELNGISIASGVSVARVTLYNVFYEIFTLCTSIVMEAEDGKMYHGRNLDFGIYMGWDPKNHTWFITEFLRPLIVKVDFMKSGKPLYSAVTYAGYTGILTGVKKNSFSLTIDERFTWDGGYIGLAEWIIGIRDSSWLGLLTRKVMESATSYDEAQQLLAQTPLVAPVYFILAGNISHQGSIVTRGRRDADIWQLGNRYKQQKGSWYLVETNYDHWKDTSFFDHRRQYAVQCMDEIGQQKPLETLYRVLSTRPILNKETTLTAVMDVREGLLDVWERDCQDPCWPF